jgi:hypothetical protein
MWISSRVDYVRVDYVINAKVRHSIMGARYRPRRLGIMGGGGSATMVGVFSIRMYGLWDLQFQLESRGMGGGGGHAPQPACGHFFHIFASSLGDVESK